ncbi:hypothetical protein Bca52824_002218 [Brassica carinata]|uniref:Uncharacterized protein n=1 Tax=Brassica carinata TaxID=52824 RepID=A0A8X7WHI5_BRACI|nr:hypothetical protein Bca52824_002218 [Brassica carinata]
MYLSPPPREASAAPETTVTKLSDHHHHCLPRNSMPHIGRIRIGNWSEKLEKFPMFDFGYRKLQEKPETEKPSFVSDEEGGIVLISNNLSSSSSSSSRIFEKLKSFEAPSSPTYNEEGEENGRGLRMGKRLLRSLSLVFGSILVASLRF